MVGERIVCAGSRRRRAHFQRRHLQNDDRANSSDSVCARAGDPPFLSLSLPTLFLLFFLRSLRCASIFPFVFSCLCFVCGFCCSRYAARSHDDWVSQCCKKKKREEMNEKRLQGKLRCAHTHTLFHSRSLASVIPSKSVSPATPLSQPPPPQSAMSVVRLLHF